MVKDLSEEAFTPGVGASSAHSGHSPAHREDAPVDAAPTLEGGGTPDAPHAGEHVAGGPAADTAIVEQPPAGLRTDDAGTDDAGPAAEAQGATAALAAVVVPEKPREVTVEEGETLGSIAARWGVDEGELAALNAWLVPNPRSLFPGQILRLPA